MFSSASSASLTQCSGLPERTPRAGGRVELDKRNLIPHHTEGSPPPYHQQAQRIFWVTGSDVNLGLQNSPLRQDFSKDTYPRRGNEALGEQTLTSGPNRGMDHQDVGAQVTWTPEANLLETPASTQSAKQTFQDGSPSPKDESRAPIPIRRERLKPPGSLSSRQLPDDGYQWHKYGHKTLMDNSFSRAYYRCAQRPQGCNAKKTVDFPLKKMKELRITYDGTHNHEPSTDVLNTSTVVVRHKGQVDMEATFHGTAGQWVAHSVVSSASAAAAPATGSTARGVAPASRRISVPDKGLIPLGSRQLVLAKPRPAALLSVATEDGDVHTQHKSSLIDHPGTHSMNGRPPFQHGFHAGMVPLEDPLCAQRHESTQQDHRRFSQAGQELWTEDYQQRQLEGRVFNKRDHRHLDEENAATPEWQARSAIVGSYQGSGKSTYNFTAPTHSSLHGEGTDPSLHASSGVSNAEGSVPEQGWHKGLSQLSGRQAQPTHQVLDSASPSTMYQEHTRTSSAADRSHEDGPWFSRQHSAQVKQVSPDMGGLPANATRKRVRDGVPEYLERQSRRAEDPGQTPDATAYMHSFRSTNAKVAAVQNERQIDPPRCLQFMSGNSGRSVPSPPQEPQVQPGEVTGAKFELRERNYLLLLKKIEAHGQAQDMSNMVRDTAGQKVDLVLRL